MKDNFPRFIVDKPQGEDVFEGQSQTKLAKNISDYILSADKEEAEKDDQTYIPRIIGIEGSWGAGKANGFGNALHLSERRTADCTYPRTSRNLRTIS